MDVGLQPPQFPPGTTAKDITDALSGLGNAFAQVGPIKSAIAGFKAPGQAYQSTEPLTSEQMIAPAHDMTTFAGSASIPFAQKGAAGIFGGRLAKTADKDALMEAQRMEMQGAPKTDIWDNTGWHKGLENKWRFEIPDTNLALNKNQLQPASVNYDPNFLSLNKPAVPLGDLFQHDALYKAYPHLEFAPISTASLAGSGKNLGSFNSASGKFTFAPNTPDEIVNTLLHEGQHAVQHAEGFHAGSNPVHFKPLGYGDLKNKMQDQGNFIVDHMAQLGMPRPNIEQAFNAALSHVKGAPLTLEGQQLLQPLADSGKLDYFMNFVKAKDFAHEKIEIPAYNSYRNMPGEVEARNVEHRAVTPGAYSKYPWETAAVPETSQHAAVMQMLRALNNPR